MRIGIFSDVHGNQEALERAISFMRAEGVTEFICLGDIVGYGANPEECVVMIRELNAVVVAGNHDYGAVGKTALRNFNAVARKALLWTQHQLTDSSKAYLESLPTWAIHQSFRLIHASPAAPSEWEYLRSWNDIRDAFEFFPERFCFVGHTHLPIAGRKHHARPEPQQVLEREFSVANHASRFLVNVGSIGQPRDGDPRLCLVIFDTKQEQLRFHRLDYDIDQAQRKIIAAGLPSVLAQRLSEGW